MSFTLLGILNAQAAGGGAVGPAYDHLSTTILSSNVSSISITGLQVYSEYKHLEVRVAGKVQSSTEIKMRINNVSSAVYSAHGFAAAGNVTFPFAHLSRTSMDFIGGMSQQGYSGSIITIMEQSSTTKQKTVRAKTGGPSIGVNSGLFQSTAAVTSLQFFVASNLIVSGTRFSIYGIRG